MPNKETTITFKDDDSHAEVWTESRRMRKNLEKAGYEADESDDEGTTFLIPVEMISMTGGSKKAKRTRSPMVMTEEERLDRIYRLRAGKMAKDLGRDLKKKEAATLRAEIEERYGRAEAEADDEVDVTPDEEEGDDDGDDGDEDDDGDFEEEEEEQEEPEPVKAKARKGKAKVSK